MKKSTTKKPKLKPVELKHVASGEMWMVPGDVFADGGGVAASKWIDARIAERKEAEFYKQEAERKAAEAAKNAPPVVGEPTRDDLQAEVKKLQSQVSRLNDQLETYKHRLQLKEEIITDLNAAHNHRRINHEPLEDYKQSLAEKAKLADRRRARNSELFERIRAGEYVPESAFSAPLTVDVPEEASD